MVVVGVFKVENKQKQAYQEMSLSVDVFYTGAETGINKYSLADEVVSSSSCVYWQFTSRLGANVTSCAELCTSVVGQGSMLLCES